MFIPLKDENPTEKRPVLTVLIIAVNAAVFIYSIATGKLPQIAETWGMRPNKIASGTELCTIFTSMFIHGGIFHAAGNLWFLYIFGDNIEDLFGRSEFLLIYFLSGVLASFAYVLFNPNSTSVTIGASGAIAGVLGAYTVKFPRARVLTLFFWIVLRIPAFVFLGIWILMQVFYAGYTVVPGVETSVAFWAHIGGFIAGGALAMALPTREISYDRRQRVELYSVTKNQMPLKQQHLTKL